MPFPWNELKEKYIEQTPLMNLNNAAVSTPLKEVEQTLFSTVRFIHQNPDYNMWSNIDNELPETKKLLARLAECQSDEIALLRNATEGLSLVIKGIELKENDEVVICQWDYPSAINGWRNREEREGIKLVFAEININAGKEDFIRAYLSSITNKTKVIHITHMLHWNGNVLPVEEICKHAHKLGIITVVDGAQSFCQLPFSFKNVCPDYYITSLHKWLGAPVGNGMVIINSKRINETLPLQVPFTIGDDSIDKFDHWNLGTYNSAVQYAIIPAIKNFINIGVLNINQRLNYLSRYWIDKAKKIPGFHLYTPINENLCGLVLFTIEGYNPLHLERELRNKYHIHTKYRKIADVEGIRVSPHYTHSEKDMDYFVSSLMRIIA